MADTYSFDVVSDFDRQELLNAVDQSRREIDQRYDLKDSNSEVKSAADSSGKYNATYKRSFRAKDS